MLTRGKYQTAPEVHQTVAGFFNLLRTQVGPNKYSECEVSSF
jgi:hypothetical protein